MLEIFQDIPQDYVVFFTMFVISSFVILYAIALLNQKLSVLESEVAELKKEHSLMTDELEIVASSKRDKKH